MDRLLTIEEVAEILKIKKISIYGMVHRKNIPCLKISKKILRFRESEILTWLDSKSQPIGTKNRHMPVKLSSQKQNVAASSIHGIVKRAKQECLNRTKEE